MNRNETGQGIDAFFSEHCVIPQNEKQWPELTAPLFAEFKNEVSWNAKGVCFWETVFEDNYTLCVRAGEKTSCRIIRCF